MKRFVAILVIVLSFAPAFAQTTPSKPALKHSDYEIWNTASDSAIAPDGRWFIYQRMPAEGDGSIIVKSLTGGPTFTFPQGSRSGIPEATLGSLDGQPLFTPDGKRVYFTLVPTKAERDRARASKKAARVELAVLELATGKIVERIGNLKTYAILDKTNFALLHREPRKADPTALAAAIGGSSLVPPAATEPSPSPTGTPPRGPGRRPGTGPRTTPTTPATSETSPKPVGSDLIVRNLADGSERTISDVQGFDKTRDETLLVISRVSATDSQNGLFAYQPGEKDLRPILSGRGNYSRDRWDEPQRRLAFFHEEPAPETKSGEPKPVVKPRVYIWDRSAKSTAALVLSDTIAGLEPGMMLAERGGLRFSEDGLKLALATTKIPETKKDPPRPANAPRTDAVNLDLWHWKDDLIQPMQKIRGDTDRNRVFTAVYFFDTKQFRQLSDDNRSVPVPGYGDWTLATNEQPYKHLTGYGPSLADYSLVNVRNGESKTILTAHEGVPSPSPKGRYRVHFDGKDWHAIALPDGRSINLTAKLPVKFFNEDFDQPMKAPPYGIVGWTEDERFLLVADRYDIWKLAPDGSSANNLTKIGRSMKIRFTPIVFPDPDDQPRRGIDLGQPLLLKATNLTTYDSGFFRLDPGGSPKMLVMGGREYGRPTKARRAGTLVFTVSTFADYPDYYSADPTFKEVRRITDINPRTREFNWGRSELVTYKNLDGIELSGVLIKPENFDAQKKYPMIVFIYERLSDDLHRFRLPSAGTSINPTYYASNGYLVFMPDITYNVGTPGQSALKCVLPAIQAVVDKGCVEESAIGIQGHSWGGYQIAYMVTQTTRFKAAASGAPVSNMVSAYGGIRWGTGLPRQFQYERTQSRIGATLWESPTKYIENSPIFQADRVTTPLMILHNDQDDAVPWYQGIEYYLALRRLGKECYLFNYNGEKHGLRSKATQRDYTLRMQQFFDHHLKGQPMPEWMKSGIPFPDRDKEKDQWKSLFK